MSGTILKLALLGLLTCSSALAQVAKVGDQPRNIILVGWDGANRDHVKALLKDGSLPNLHRLVAEGTIVDIDVPEVTDTKSGWTQILTGYRAEVTGVFSNSRYQPIPVGYTVFERLRKFFGADKFATVAVIGKKAHVDADGPKKIPLAVWEARKARLAARAAANPLRPVPRPEPGGKLIEENGEKFWAIPGKPWLNAKDNMDVFINGLMQDARVGDKALELLDLFKDRPFFFFVHFAEVDHTGHKLGEDSRQYDQAIVSGDRQLGRIVEKLGELGLKDKTLIYVTADHGFDIGGKGHRNAPHVFLATNDRKVVRGGTRADIAPTILERFGMDLARLDPKLDGQPLTGPASATQPDWTRPGRVRLRPAGAARQAATQPAGS